MAQDQERQDEPPRGPEPAARPLRQLSGSGRRLHLYVRVPRVVDDVLTRAGLDPGAEINRVIGALFRKLTPERGPANKGSYPGEVCYFERLRNSPPETLTVLERLFVSLNAEHEELLEQVQAAGDDADRAEVDQAAADLADWVHTIQEELRSRRGKDTAQFEWEVTEP